MSLSNTGTSNLESEQVASGNTPIQFVLMPVGTTHVDSSGGSHRCDLQSGVDRSINRAPLHVHILASHPG